MIRASLRVLVLAAVVAAAAGAPILTAPAAYADHIPDPDVVHAPLQFAAEFSVPGPAGTFFGIAPYSVAVGTDRIFVTDQNDGRVHIFDMSGSYVGAFGSRGDGLGEFGSSDYAGGPGGIALGPSNVFVADTYNDRIQIFDLSGSYVGAFGTSGEGPGQFFQPEGIALNSTHVFVADTLNNRVQVFDMAGRHAGTFGGGTNTTGYWVPGLGHLDGPSNIALNSTHIFVAERYADRVQMFDMAGNYVGLFGSGGIRPGQFNGIFGIAANSTHLFVADSGNDRIQIFDHTGNYAGQFGSYGTGPGQFGGISDITANSTHLFVADSNHLSMADTYRIQIFKMAGN